ncbi:hypothetical protein PCASD_10852 [Puccinia coronata f. sp. avenae]|uniref:Uncharacterized protein n=1 Tax=Puccinia coronata f. sp. avenae TaxID=200324 RepID=A0A2N5UU57_9BASI|nr:hypothetical protein PCASD_10852 [Puccinia coronata f. sp. avenae]
MLAVFMKIKRKPHLSVKVTLIQSSQPTNPAHSVNSEFFKHLHSHPLSSKVLMYQQYSASLKFSAVQVALNGATLEEINRMYAAQISVDSL